MGGNRMARFISRTLLCLCRPGFFGCDETANTSTSQETAGMVTAVGGEAGGSGPVAGRPMVMPAPIAGAT